MTELKKKLAHVLILCLGLCPWFAGHAHAGPEKFVPFVSVSREYTDNIFFSSEGEKSDSITGAAAGLTFSRYLPESRFRITGGLKRLMYSENSELDSTDRFLESGFSLKTDPRTDMQASVKYSRDSRRDMDPDNTGIILGHPRERTDISFSYARMFSELLRGSVSFSYGFTDTGSISTDEENDVLGMNIGFSRDMSWCFRNLTGLFNMSWFRYASDTSTHVQTGLTSVYLRSFETDVAGVSLGFSKKMTECTDLRVTAGINYTATRENQTLTWPGTGLPDMVSDRVTSRKTGGILSAQVNYKGLYTDADFILSHDVRGGSGTNGSVERSSAQAGIRVKVSEEFALDLETSCYLNRNRPRTRPDLDDLTINVMPGFRYVLDDGFVLTGGLRYTCLVNRQNNDTGRRTMIYAQIRKNFDL